MSAHLCSFLPPFVLIWLKWSVRWLNLIEKVKNKSQLASSQRGIVSFAKTWTFLIPFLTNTLRALVGLSSHLGWKKSVFFGYLFFTKYWQSCYHHTANGIYNYTVVHIQMYVRDMFCACCNALTCTFCKTVHLNDIHLAFLIYIYIYTCTWYSLQPHCLLSIYASSQAYHIHAVV